MTIEERLADLEAETSKEFSIHCASIVAIFFWGAWMKHFMRVIEISWCDLFFYVLLWGCAGFVFQPLLYAYRLRKIRRTS